MGAIVSVPDPKPTPAQITFGIAHRMRSGDETMGADALLASLKMFYTTFFLSVFLAADLTAKVHVHSFS